MNESFKKDNAAVALDTNNDCHCLKKSNCNVGLLLVNLGTPKSTGINDIKEYIRSFLSDNRVVELPRFIWQIILRTIVLRTRPRKLKKLYEKIWMTEGSPLYVYSKRQALKLERIFLQKNINIKIKFCMRYGYPNIKESLDSLIFEPCEKILLFPLFPQYSSSTTGSIVEYVSRYLICKRDIPEFRYIKRFNSSKFYIDSLVSNIHNYWNKHGLPDALVVSFHGLPQYSIDKGDPYYKDCIETFELLSNQLNFDQNIIYISFQSKFGYSKWIKPYTSETLVNLAKRGVARVDVVCPGFISDCLETLEEINDQCRHLFLSSGGKDFHYINALNDNEEWITGLENLIKTHIYDWGVV
ncbi:MAG: ferrochelatase [Candidatus Kinetoplastibacterium crithidii]|nr:ferrochelatase [Candidatus Kinetoplastibacterium crithidii]